MRYKAFALFLLGLFFSNQMYAFVDGICAAAAPNLQCARGLPGSPNWYVAGSIGSQNLQMAIGMQNYASIAAKALVGAPIETVVIPSCLVMTSNCANPWAASLDPVTVGTFLTLTINSTGGTDGKGNLVFPNQSDANYKLVAHPDYCSCGDYNSGANEYCNRIVKAINAGAPYNSIYNPQSPTPPFVPCATGTYPGNTTPSQAGFWVLNLVSPNGTVPPAGNYNATITIDLEQSPD